MADDDIEKLLRELGTTGKPAGSPGGEVARPGASPARREAGSSGGRLAFAGIAAAGLGVTSWFLGLVLPFTSAVSAGIGGAFAAFVVAIIAGPPRWFSS